MEANGAVFLPASGLRTGNTMYSSNIMAKSVGVLGNYWSSTVYNQNSIYGVYFNSNTFYCQKDLTRGLGRAVRLVVNL